MKLTDLRSKAIIESPAQEKEEKSPEQGAFDMNFDQILKKYSADKLTDIPDDKKDEFFKEVKKSWEKHPLNQPEEE